MTHVPNRLDLRGSRITLGAVSHGEIKSDAGPSGAADGTSRGPGGWIVSAFAPWVVLVLGLATTAWLTASARHEMTARDAERFHHETERVVLEVEAGLRTCAQALMGLRDRYFVYQSNITLETWRSLISTLHIPAHYPGLWDVGFVESVYDGSAPNKLPKREEHLRRMRARLGPDYRFKLPPGGVAGLGWYHMPVVWHSYAQWRRDPVREYPHYGMDLNQNPDLWAAMNWALGDDRPALSGRQILDPDRPEFTGLMLFAPVYTSAVTWNTNETPAVVHAAHLAYLRGLVFGGIDMKAFLQHHLGTNQPTVTFALYASTNQTANVGPEHLLFDNRSPARDGKSDAKGETRIAPPKPRELPLYGRTLSFVFEPGPGFVSALNERTLWFAASFGIATTLLLAGFIEYQARAHRQEKQTSGALRESELRLQALIRERELSSRDLHDGVLQSLYALGLGLQKTRKVLQRDPKRAEDCCRQNMEALELVMTELRRHLGQGKRPLLQDLDLATALKALATANDRNGTVPVRLEMEANSMGALSQEEAFHLLQIAREALSNAQRHSLASLVQVRVRRESDTLELVVEDNGVGFETAGENHEGCGLRNLKARIDDMGGEFSLDSRPGGGTRVVVRISVARCSEVKSNGTGTL